MSRGCISQHVLYMMLGLGLDNGDDAMGTRQIWPHILELRV